MALNLRFPTDKGVWKYKYFFKGIESQCTYFERVRIFDQVQSIQPTIFLQQRLAFFEHLHQFDLQAAEIRKQYSDLALLKEHLNG